MDEQTKTPRMRVKLGELNKLKFALSIKASTSDSTISKPEFRFLIRDPESSMSFCFPMEKTEEGDVVSVSIPGNPNFFREGVDYLGKVEVILGNFWFSPTSVRLQFEQKLEVQASSLIAEEDAITVEEIQEEIRTEEKSELDAVIKPEPKPTKKKQLFNEEALLDILFTETRIKPTAQQSTSGPVKKTPQKVVVDPKVTKMKNRLKLMISEALGELEE